MLSPGYGILRVSAVWATENMVIKIIALKKGVFYEK